MGEGKAFLNHNVLKKGEELMWEGPPSEKGQKKERNKKMNRRSAKPSFRKVKTAEATRTIK